VAFDGWNSWTHGWIPCLGAWFGSQGIDVCTHSVCAGRVSDYDIIDWSVASGWTLVLPQSYSFALNSYLFVLYLSYIGYIAEMVAVGKAIHHYNPELSITPAYSSTYTSSNNMTNRRFLGAMGILGIMAYGVSLLGSLTFFLLALMAYQSRLPHKQNSTLYKGHLGVFSFVLFMAGLTQFMLGCYLAARFGRMHGGTVVAGFYFVSRPGIAIFVGALQLIGGLAGMIHGYGMRSLWADKSKSFLYYMAFTWLSQVVLQAFTQSAYARSAIGAGFAPTVMAFTIPLNLMPAYLQYKAAKVPDDIGGDYYGIDSSHHGGAGGAMQSGEHQGMHGDVEDTEPAEHDEPVVFPTSTYPTSTVTSTTFPTSTVPISRV
jgi:hypothetical protein